MACRKKEYGNRVVTISREGGPTIHELRLILNNYEEARRQYGWGLGEDSKATLVLGPHNGQFGTAGWYLQVHDEGCCLA